MLLTISTTHYPATDLGFLLHKHPEKIQSFALSFGQAHVFYPEVSERRCTAALLLDIDPVALSRRETPSDSSPLLPYVNDRPYVASSFLSVAIAQVFGTALSGHCKDRPELVNEPIDLHAELSVLPCQGGAALVHSLFEPLGYQIELREHPGDPDYPGGPRYYALRLRGTVRLKELLDHLYVLIPVLDNEKHYWVDKDEVEKLLRHGEGWLASHPAKENIARRYLKHRKALADAALNRLMGPEEPLLEEAEVEADKEEAEREKTLSLNEQRLQAVHAALRDEGVRSVLDLGCGEGSLLRKLLADRHMGRIIGLDVSSRCLEIAARRLHLDKLAPKVKERLELRQGSVFYRDKGLSGFDAAAVVEVIEHLESDRLSDFELVLFGHTRPTVIVVTTPNIEYNRKFAGLSPGKLRHRDHRFEFSCPQFEAWASQVADRYGYGVRFAPIGDVDPVLGPPTQMAVFRLASSSSDKGGAQ